ncbi:hypothetical protein HQ531_07285 [bacterium]|nr:hypothetical protein [bacterium]
MFRIGIILLVMSLPQLGFAGEEVVIDLKVALIETTDLAPAQAGATVYIMKSDWATVSDMGEDFAVWLKDYERSKNFIGQQVISLTLEVREPSMLRIGNLLKKKRLTVRYWDNSSKSDKFDHQIFNELNDLSSELQLEAYHLGLKIESNLKSMLK